MKYICFWSLLWAMIMMAGFLCGAVGLTKVYDLQGLNFILTKGDSCLIIGASGSGKSSLLRAIAGTPSLSAVSKGADRLLANQGSHESFLCVGRSMGFWLRGRFHPKYTGHVLFASKAFYATWKSSPAASFSFRFVLAHCRYWNTFAAL